MKIAVIGHGTMGKRHEVTALEWGAEICTPPNADIVVIDTPDNLHQNTAQHFLSLGVPVFCEKPLATNLGGIESLEFWAARTPLGCHLPLRQCKDEFEIVGNRFIATYDYGRKTKFLTSWRNAPDYDLVMGGGIHMMDLIMQKFPGEPVTITNASRYKLMPESKCPDWFGGGFKIGDRIGALVVDFTQEGPHRHIVNWIDSSWENQHELDKSAQLRAFLDKPETDWAAIEAHRMCLRFP